MEIDSKERVAFDLMKLILGQPCPAEKVPTDRAGILDLYHECLTAARGHRSGKPATVCSPFPGY